MELGLDSCVKTISVIPRPSLTTINVFFNLVGWLSNCAHIFWGKTVSVGCFYFCSLFNREFCDEVKYPDTERIQSIFGTEREIV